MVAILAIFLLRPPRARALAPRTSVGDQVSTSDGLSGTVVRLDGAFVLVDAGDARKVWARGADLLVGDGTAALPGDSSGHAETVAAPPAAVTDASGFLPRFAEGVFAARTTIVWSWALAVL
ncbi:MAG: hypothetical protein H7287_02270, partial [Thermoleophilia bacterium]|nr:hypothetical protein [Thermoleophilia bacterium]